MLLVMAGLGLVKYLQIAAAMAQAFTPPPEAVTSIVAATEQWQRSFEAVGSLAPVQGVVLRAEEPGKVVRIAFESGQQVKQGDILVELDTSVEEADLAGALAAKDRALKNLARMRNLKPSQVISQDAMDQSESDARQSDARVKSLEAVIAKKKIAAPFSGRTGIRMVNIGEYVEPGKDIVPLHAMESMYVNFSLPQQSVGSVATGQTVNFTVDAYPGETFSATLTAVNPQISDKTRMVDLQAAVPNPGEKLRAGMFAAISLLMPEKDSVVAIPATSINYAPYGDSVYVIEPMKDPKGNEYKGVRQQIVKLGAKRGDKIAVLAGLEAGQEIVTSGLFKLRPGAAIAVNNSVTPGNSLNPAPQDS